MSFNVDGGLQSFDVVARPFSSSQPGGFALLVLTPHTALEPSEPLAEIEIDPSGQAQIAELELSLSRARDELNRTVEELEASNEELQASNEELLAANEELQSTNEELQSVNEELHTVNVEFQQKTEELSELNSEMGHLLDSTEIATIFLDADLRIRRMTDTAEDLFSARLTDVGRPLGDFTSSFAAEESGTLLTAAAAVFRTGTPHETELQTDEGRWFLRRINPFIDGDGEPDGVVISFVDIDAAKRAQDDVARSEERYLEAQRIAQMGDFTWDVASGAVTWSPMLYELFGVPEGEPLEFDDVHTEIHTDDERPGIEAWLSASLESDDGVLPRYRYRTERRDGQAIDVEVQGVVRRRPDGSQFVAGTVVDVTKQVELEHTNERIMKSSISGIFIQSLVGDGFVVANARLAAIWGHPIGAITSWTDSEIEQAIVDADRAHHQTFLDELRRADDDALHTVEFRVVSASGDLRWLMAMGSVFDRDGDGAAVSILGFAVDITEQKAVEDELRRRNEELAQFASLAAHDLQEPLRTLRNYSQILVEDLGAELDDSVRTSLDFISSSATRMSQLIH
ncbi:MAG: PAS domain-containing protein, partial [Actinomycetota bacterium]